MAFDNNQQAFFELLRAGLWEKEAWLSQYDDIDFFAIKNIAEEQSVVGLITAGLEQVRDVKVRQEVLLQFIGSTLQLEQRNRAMNSFIHEQYSQLQQSGIKSILVKGQGVAQCYNKPLWRSPGDIDLLLDEENYKKAKQWYKGKGALTEPENKYQRHYSLRVDDWIVELHGSMREELSKGWDKELDSIQGKIFEDQHIRGWNNGDVLVLLPEPTYDVALVFSHIVAHLYKGGVGLRQVCDWCRLLWTYSKEIDVNTLKCSISDMGILAEWKVFAVVARTYLDMPLDCIPFYEENRSLSRRAKRLLNYIGETGNFGHNRDDSYHERYPYLVYKFISLWRRMLDFFVHITISPKNATRFMMRYVVSGLTTVARENVIK